MKVVVTGGLGFVGVNMALEYLKNGHKVIIIDNHFKHLGSHNNRVLLEKYGGIVEYVDIRNYNDLDIFFQKYIDVDVIFHLAAQVAFKISVQNPRLDFEINALGTFNLLEILRIKSPNTIFINASTNQVYGRLKNEEVKEYEFRYDYVKLLNGVDEEYPMEFLSPYGCSKGAAEQYVLDYARIYGLRTMVARFGGIYGAYQYSYEDHGWVSYISEMVQKNLEFNRFGHGKQVRDILYISDIVEALKKCAYLIDNIKGEAINIAGGKENSISVLELLKLLENITGNKEKSKINPMRKGDKLVMYLDISKAKKLLDWQPNISKEDGIRKMLNWLKEKQ